MLANGSRATAVSAAQRTRLTEPWHAATTLQRRVALILLLGLCTNGCSERIEIPLPDLGGANSPVVSKISAARKAVEDSPKSAQAWGYLATVLHAHEFFDEARICYDHAARLDPSVFRWPYLAGVIAATDNPGQALEYFERAAVLEPRYAPIRYSLAKALMVMGREQEARREYEAALKANPKCREALVGLGALELRDEAVEQSRRLLQRAADLNFYDREVHSLLARAHRMLGNTEQAQTEALLVKVYPDTAPSEDPVRSKVFDEAVNDRGHYRRGLNFFKKGAFAQAETEFRRAMQLRSNYAGDHLNLARALAKQGRLADAIRYFESAMAINPDSADIHNVYGAALEEAGQSEQAMKHFQAAFALDPQSDKALFNAGLVLERQGRIDGAIGAYRRALVLNPANATAHARLGNLLVASDPRVGLEGAMPHWRKAIQYDPNKYEAILRLAFAYADLGRFDEADRLLRWGLRRAPDNPMMLSGMATVLASCPDRRYRDGSEAVRLTEKLLAMHGPDHVPSLILRAAAWAEVGDFSGAVSTAERALRLAQSAEDQAAVTLIRARLELYRDSRD